MKVLESISFCQQNKVPGLLVSFNFHKAFDTVEWEAISLALEKFGFGKNYINMVKILYTDLQICAANNGYWTQFFNPTRATRQGCCYSPCILNLVVELLGLGIRQNTNIKGIQLNETSKIKAGQFADDLWTILFASEDNLNEVLCELHSFGELSGLDINPEKSNLLCLGTFKDSEAKFYTLKQLFWSPGPVKILGIYIDTDLENIFHKNYWELLDKAKVILSSWSKQSLTLMGKITIINSLVITLFIHKFLALPSPPDQFLVHTKELFWTSYGITKDQE